MRTRSNHESIATAHLLVKRMSVFLPAATVPSRRRDRLRLITRPLFPGYIFIKSEMERAERIEILASPGVVGILGSSAGPAPIPGSQIESIRRALKTRNPCEVIYDLVPGRFVRIVRGPLAGVEGVVIAAPDGSSRIAISIELLGRTVQFRLSSYDILPL